MQGIPIVVSRITGSGKKQVYTVRDSINEQDDIKNYYQPSPDFLTVDHCKEKQNKVRIRRIQSSGSKRKFPKDFFSRQSCKPQRNTTLKENQIIQNLQRETGSFATLNDGNIVLQPQAQDTLETPKFKGKSQTQRVNLYKNRTLKQSIKKAVSKKQKNQHQNSAQKPINNCINSLENTFSGKQFKSIHQENIPLDLRAVLQPNKQNLPIKRIKVTKENFMKKFSFLKQKQNLFKLKNLKQ